MSDNRNAETVVVTNATLLCSVLVSKLDSRAALQTYFSGQKSKWDEVKRRIALPIYMNNVSFSSGMFSQKSKRFEKRLAPRFRRLSALLSDTWLLSFWLSLLLLLLLLLLTTKETLENDTDLRIIVDYEYHQFIAVDVIS